MRTSAPLHLRERLAEELGKFLCQPVSVHAERHQGNPQPDIITLMGAESTRMCLVFLDLVPLGWVLKPVDSRRMKEFLPVDRQHEHPWGKMKRTFVAASCGETEVPCCRRQDLNLHVHG